MADQADEHKRVVTISNVITECRPRNDCLDIRIRLANRGYILQIGCAEIVFESVVDLLDCLGAYLENPSKYTFEYNNQLDKYEQDHGIDNTPDPPIEIESSIPTTQDMAQTVVESTAEAFRKSEAFRE